MPGPRVWGKYLWRRPHSTGCPGAMWWLLLWGVLQACPTGGSILLAQELPQQLTSPGYPEPSADIKAPEGFAVRLVFQDFDLEPSQDCAGDSVTISASGSDPSQFCGQQDAPLGRPPGQREFVSSGRSLRLTFRTQPSSENKTVHLHKGFLALYQTVAVNYSQPISEASRGSEAISAPGDNPAKVQNHCQEPYYQAAVAGTLTGTNPGTWKDRQDGKEVLQCMPVIPIAQNQTTLRSSRAKLGNFPWQAFTVSMAVGAGDSVLSRKNRSVMYEMLKLGNHPVRRVMCAPALRQNDGDIALLELQHSIPLGPNISRSVLPIMRPSTAAACWATSVVGVEMGWLTTELKYLQAACLAQKRQRPRCFLTICLCWGRDARHSVCQGDSGSVYVVWDDRAHHWVATGIVSWGIGCGEGMTSTPSVSYVDWIKGVMNGKT
uniref:Complement C1r subcomponent like n=1 Tax=Macaca nemestrina TaxID=9545 RepID=A0A2K6BKM0_MACNE